QHVVGVELIDGQCVNGRRVADAQPGDVLEAIKHEEHLADVAGDGGQRGQRGLRRRLVTGNDLGDDVDLAVAGPVRQGATEGGRDHLLGGALRVVTRGGAVDHTTAGPDRGTPRAV